MANGNPELTPDQLISSSSRRSLKMVLFVSFALVLGCACTPCPSLKTENKHSVMYAVSGGGGSASVIFTNEKGATEQADVMVPWANAFTAQEGQALYLSVRNKGDYQIFPEIWVDGTVKKQSVAAGQYSAATCASLCCE